MAIKEDFMTLVQSHERAWGNETYLGRPSLQSIINSSVVTVWRPLKDDKHKRFKLKVFNSTKEIEEYMTKLLFRAEIKPLEERLMHIFVDRKPVIVQAVRIVFQELPTE